MKFSKIFSGKPADDLIDPLTQERFRHPDEKIAYVTFQRDLKFEFPDIFVEKKEDSMVTKRAKKKLNEEEKEKRKFRDRPGIPSWFQT